MDAYILTCGLLASAWVIAHSLNFLTKAFLEFIAVFNNFNKILIEFLDIAERNKNERDER